MVELIPDETTRVVVYILLSILLVTRAILTIDRLNKKGNDGRNDSINS